MSHRICTLGQFRTDLVLFSIAHVVSLCKRRQKRNIYNWFLFQSQIYSAHKTCVPHWKFKRKSIQNNPISYRDLVVPILLSLLFPFIASYIRMFSLKIRKQRTDFKVVLTKNEPLKNIILVCFKKALLYYIVLKKSKSRLRMLIASKN